MNFTLAPFSVEDSTAIIDSLKTNKVIKSLSFVLLKECAHQLIDLLTENSTLELLGLTFENSDITKQIKLALSKNKTLQTLHVISKGGLNAKIILRSNVSRFKITNIFHSFSEDQLGKFWREMSDILLKKKALDTIVVKENGRLLDNQLVAAEKLQANKRRKEKRKRNTEMLIRSMALRPQLYLSMLPLEIWSNIFKRISFPGVYADFNDALLQAFKNVT